MFKNIFGSMSNIFRKDIENIILSGKSMGEWEQYFSKMEILEFNDFGGNVLTWVEGSIKNHNNTKYRNDTSTLLFALAKYAMEAANFQKNMDLNRRIAMEGMANSYHNAAEAFERYCLNEKRLMDYKNAWEALKDHCEKYGYKSIAYAELCNRESFEFFARI